MSRKAMRKMGLSLVHLGKMYRRILFVLNVGWEKKILR